MGALIGWRECMKALVGCEVVARLRNQPILGRVLETFGEQQQPALGRSE